MLFDLLKSVPVASNFGLCVGVVDNFVHVYFNVRLCYTNTLNFILKIESYKFLTLSYCTMNQNYLLIAPSTRLALLSAITDISHMAM